MYPPRDCARPHLARLAVSTGGKIGIQEGKEGRRGEEASKKTPTDRPTTTANRDRPQIVSPSAAEAAAEAAALIPKRATH